MAVDERDARVIPEAKPGFGLGLLKGLGVTLKALLRPAVRSEEHTSELQSH